MIGWITTGTTANYKKAKNAVGLSALGKSPTPSPTASLQAENPSARRLSGMELTLGSPRASQYLDVFNREMKPRSANWAIWWSDLMMTMFIMFAALYAFQMPVSRAVPSPSEPMPVVVRPRSDDAGSILVDHSAASRMFHTR